MTYNSRYAMKPNKIKPNTYTYICVCGGGVVLKLDSILFYFEENFWQSHSFLIRVILD